MISIEYCICLLINCSISGKIISVLMKRQLGQQDQMQSARNQVTRTLVLNNIVFFLCQLPVRCAELDEFLRNVSNIGFLEANEYKLVYAIGHIFLLLNSCINPIVYVCCCKKYRNAMRDTLQKYCCPCRTSSTDLGSCRTDMKF